ncbi:MAG: tonB-dependent siderophore receptor family protein [Sphingomonadales bacterium]|nr:tonB-dependent siderophore receptor family protein [Sphingomonadales bacterium]
MMKISLQSKMRFGLMASSILAGTVLAISSASAQSSTDATQTANANDIVVQGMRATTATKTDTPILQIPQSISVVSAEEIIARGAPTLQDALNYTAGITSAGNDTRGDFSVIRGLDSVVFLDGLKRNFGFVYLPRSEVYTLERVEALLGPSAVLYGAGSAGGLINMVSKKPQFTFGGEVSASYGTYNRKQGQIDLTGPLSETIAVRLVAVVRDSDSQLNYLPDNRVVVQPSITWKPTDLTSLTLLGLYQRDYTGPSAYMPLDATLYAPPGRRISSSTLIGEPDFNRGPKRDTSLTLMFDHKFSDALSIHNSTRYDDAHTTYGEIYQYGVFTTPGEAGLPANCVGTTNTCVERNLFAYDAKYRTFSTDNRVEWNISTGPLEHKFLAGFDYSSFRQLASQAYGGSTPINIYDPVYGNYPAATFFPETRQTLKQTGFYAQDQIRIYDRASLVVGLRHDNLKTQNTGLPNTTDNVMSYRAGLTVDITKTIAPYASYSESFQPISGLNQFNQAFKPLFGKAKEVGVKWQPLRSTLFRVDYYWISENNHVVPDPAAPLVSIQGGQQKSHGFEFQVDHRMKDLTVTASYAHNSGTLIDASGVVTPLDQNQKDTGSIFATNVFPLGNDANIKIGAGARHVASVLSGTVVNPARTLVDALIEANYQHWTIQVNALNLFDKFYYATCSQYLACTSGEPRMINATVRYRF